MTISEDEHHKKRDFLLSNLQKYSLTNENYNKIVSNHTSIDFNLNYDNNKIQSQINTHSSHQPAEPQTINHMRTNTYKINVKDQLFWCLMMIVNSWDENDLPEPRNRFEYEGKQKTELTELLQKNKSIPWKEMKITRTGVTTALGSSINGKIDINELKALAFLYEKNIVYTWGKSYISIPGARSLPLDKQQWNVIIKQRDGIKLATDEYSKEIMKNVENDTYYQLYDYNKPLMSEGTYKVDELREIANKFNISIIRDNGKNKTKKELYIEILDNIHKID